MSSHHPSREHSPQPSSTTQNNEQHSADHHVPEALNPDETMNNNINPPANGSNASSFTFAYHLDPVTNQLVRTPIPPQHDEQSDLPDDADIAIQARTNVTVHALDDSPSSPGAGADETQEQIPREFVESIMNTIGAMMGVVPNGNSSGGPDPNSETGRGGGVQFGTHLADMLHRNLPNAIPRMGVSSSMPNLTTSTPGSSGSSAPFAATTNAFTSNPRPIFAVEDMEEDEFADMPGLLEPSPSSSVENTPLRQTPQGSLDNIARETRRSENSNLMQSLMEAAAAERQRRQNDGNDLPPFADPFGDLPFDQANPAPAANPIPPTANVNPNANNAPTGAPNPIRITRLNASDLRGGGGANLFGFPGGLMGGLMGLPGIGLGLGIGGVPLSMLNAERPPDTRRAKELLKGLTVVPHGLVRRLERVEALKDKIVKEKMRSKGEVVENLTKSEGNAIGEGKLLCPVCYEALLPDPDANEDEQTMEVDEEDDDEMDTKPDVADSPTVDPTLPTPPLSTATSTEKAEQVKHKQKHPYQQPNAIIALPCTHIFHASSCLKPWFETGKTTCPTCRFDIDPRSETLDLSWLQNAGRRRAAANAGTNTTGNGNNPGATPAANEANANAPPTDAAPATTPGAPNADANPTLNPNPEANVNGDGNENLEGGAPGADFRQVFTNVLRNAIAQAMAAALLPPQQQQQSPPGQAGEANQGPPPQPPTLQTQGLQPGLQTQGLSPGLRTPGSHEGTRPPPSPQALAFQRAFDAQQQETASQAQGQPSEQPSDSAAPAAPNAESSNPPPTTNSANPPPPNPTPAAEGAPRMNYDVLVRDIFLADQGDGQMDVFMREMVMPPSIIPGFDWSDMPVGPGPSAAPSTNDAANANPENRSTGMEGVEAAPATPSTSTPSNSTGPSPSRFPGFGQGLRGAFTTRRAAYLTPDGVYVPAEPRANSTSNAPSGLGSGSSGLSHSSLPLSHSSFTIDVILLFDPNSNASNSTRQASTSTDPSGSQESSSTTTNLNLPTTNPSRPRTPVASATRHHPYASPRSSNVSPAPSRGIGSDEPSPNPFVSGTPTDGAAPGNGNQGDNLSFSRHSITFSFSFGRGPDGQLHGGPIPPPPPPAGNSNDNNNTTTPGQNNEGGPRRSPFGAEGFLMGGDIIFGMGPPPFGMGAGLGLGTGASPRAPRANRPKKKWVAPEGTSLRSVVEAKEREVGLRCDDVSCLWGPEDDDDLSSELKIREARVWLKKRGSDGLLEPSCAHRFHPECLLVANRVADQHLDEEIMQDGDDAVLIEAACPFCRARGALRREEWRDAREKAEAA